MKIAFLTQTTSVDSGAGRYAKSIIDGVKNAGYDALVFTEFEKNVGAGIVGRGLKFIANLYKLRISVRDCDVVHALDIWPYGLYGLISVLGTNKKLFLSGVGTYSVAPLDSPSKGYIMRLIIKRAKVVLCISNYVKEQIDKKMRGARTVVVHMGLSALKQLNPKEIQLYKDQYSLEGYGPIVLTVGAPKERKGQFDTLKSISLLKDKYPRILYIVVGTMYEAAYVDEMKEFAKNRELENNVLLVGDATSDEALSFFYSSCDVFVMNSNNSHGHFEGFGLVFLEAASFGKPVVGSRDCGIEDALEDGFNGYLTNQRDHLDIAEKIDLAIQNKEALGSKSFDFAKRFSWQKTVEKYIEFYKM